MLLAFAGGMMVSLYVEVKIFKFAGRNWDGGACRSRRYGWREARSGLPGTDNFAVHQRLGHQVEGRVSLKEILYFEN